MLVDFPILINNESIPEPVTWTETSQVIENVNTTEAGTDQVSVTRYDKLSVSCGFQCTSTWARKFKEFSILDVIEVKTYDLLSETYALRYMRIRSFKADPVKNSQRTRNTNGLWEVSFNLEEF